MFFKGVGKISWKQSALLWNLAPWYGHKDEDNFILYTP